MKRFKGILDRWWRIISGAVKGFLHDEAFMHAAALSYYSVFALPSLFILIMNTAGFFMSGKTLESGVFNEISDRLGKDTADQIQQMVTNISHSDGHFWASVVSVVVILFTASAVFYQLQRSLNTFWKLKHIGQKLFIATLIKRAASILMIFLLMILLLLSMGLEALFAHFKDYFYEYFPDLSVMVFRASKYGISLFIKMLTFVCMYKFLADGIVRWKVALVGAFYSALLFQIGEGLIGMYLSETNLADKFGAAGSVLMLFTWVYYSSLVVFFGAHITYVYGKVYKMPIEKKVKIDSDIITE